MPLLQLLVWPESHGLEVGWGTSSNNSAVINVDYPQMSDSP